jgi:hypothetical protein
VRADRSATFGCDGSELREWLAWADDDIRADWPQLDAEWKRLDLTSADDLLGAPHTAAADERYRPISDAGDTYSSMAF